MNATGRIAGLRAAKGYILLFIGATILLRPVFPVPLEAVLGAVLLILGGALFFGTWREATKA